jgi:hypothetical protein
MESHGASDGRESADALQRDTQARWVCEGAEACVSTRSMCLKKRMYWTELQAKSIAAKCVAKGAPPLRVYRCSHCPGWHLTKRPAMLGA